MQGILGKELLGTQFSFLRSCSETLVYVALLLPSFLKRPVAVYLNGATTPQAGPQIRRLRDFIGKDRKGKDAFRIEFDARKPSSLITTRALP